MINRTQINKGHLKNAGGYSGRNVVFQLANNKDRDNSPKNDTENIESDVYKGSINLSVFFGLILLQPNVRSVKGHINLSVFFGYICLSAWYYYNQMSVRSKGI